MKDKLIFINGDGKEVKNVESTTVLYKMTEGIYIPYPKVKKGKYIYSVSVKNDNYIIENVGNINTLPIPNTVVSHEYDF